MTMFRLSGGNAEQRRIVRQALRDFSAVFPGGGSRGPFVARRAGPKCRQIVIGDAPFAPGEDDEATGFCLTGDRSVLIALRPTLSNSKLYATLLHELGHAYLGPGHTPSGIMAAFDTERTWGRLTLYLRRRLCSDLGTLLLKQQISQI